MKSVTQKEWADFLNQFRTYARENTTYCMEHVNKEDGQVIAVVFYAAHDRGRQLYYILETAT